MKRIALTILFFISIWTSFPSFATEQIIDGINYSLNEEDFTATVIANNEEKYNGDIIIPPTVEYLGNSYAVVQIGDNAFSQRSISSVSIPNSVKIIGSFAFAHNYNKNFTSVTIPNSVIELGNSAFFNCFYLQEVILEDGDEQITIFDSFGSSKLSKLYLGRNYIPRGDYFRIFGLTTLTEVIIGNHVTEIPEYAFCGCSKLKYVKIAGSVKKIDTYAFDDCSKLEKAEFESIESLCNIQFSSPYANPLYYAHNLWMNGEKITDIVIPSTQTHIYNYAFIGLNANSVTLPETIQDIGTSSFSQASINSLVIPNSVVYIYSSAFQEITCSSITLPNSIKSLNTAAFSNCNIDTFTIDDGSTAIDISSDAFAEANINSMYLGRNIKNQTSTIFEGNTSISKLTIGNLVTRLNDSAFSGCSNLSNLVIKDSEVTLNIGGNTFSDVNLENLYIGRNITRSFSNMSSLKELSIGGYMTEIKGFYQCTGLTSLTIPNSIETISYAFEECDGLQEVVIEEGDTPLTLSGFSGTPIEKLYLGRDFNFNGYYKDAPFYGQEELKDLTIGQYVTQLGEYTFSNCPNLSKITFEDGDLPLVFDIDVFYGVDSISEIYLGRNASYIDGPSYTTPFCNKSISELTIGSSVNLLNKNIFGTSRSWSSINQLTIEDGSNTLNISADALRDTKIKNIYIGKNYSSDVGVFSGSIIQTVTIGANVTYIKDNEFYGCRSLKQIKIDDASTSLNLGRGVFEESTALENLTIGRDITFTRQSFANNTKLTNLTFGPLVKKIAASAFSGCTNLSKIIIPENIVEIGANAFYNCTGIKEVGFASINSLYHIGFKGPYANPLYYADHLLINDKEVTDIVIPSTLTKIGDYTFNGCKFITSLKIPSNITSIGTSTFANCTNLTSIDLPNSLISINDYAFEGCSQLSGTFEIPASVTTIGKSILKDCNNLSQLVIADGATDLIINIRSFTGCSVPLLYLGRDLKYSTLFSENILLGNIGLKKITIGGSVKSIGEYLFYNSSLTSVSIEGNSLEEIGELAFGRCLSLQSINIPSSVTKIDKGAFQMCSKLRDVQFDDMESLCKINFGDEYANPLCWSNALYINGNLITHLDIPDIINSIGDYAFNGCNSIASISIPSSITKIGKYAFTKCDGLQSIICYAETPPSIVSNTFDDTAYTKVPVKVPGKVINDYKAHDIWKNFTITAIGTLVESISLDPSSLSGTVGQSFLINASVFPADASHPILKWSSSDDNVASVDDTGLVTLHNEGECQIFARSTDGSEVESNCLVKCDFLTSIGSVDADNKESILIYNLFGVLLTKCDDLNNINDLPKGIYIIQQGNEIRKIHIK